MPHQADPDAAIALSERAVKIKRLTETPEWQELELILDERRQFHMRQMTKRMMRGNPVSVEEQLRHDGFWEGVMAVLRTPDTVEKRLEKMLETSNTGAQPKGAP